MSQPFPKHKTRAPLPGVADPRIHRLKKPNAVRRSIRLDKVHPMHINHFDLRIFCDDCSHYSTTGKICTIGFVAQHTREKQMKLYELTGQIAFCRFLEID